MFVIPLLRKGGKDMPYNPYFNLQLDTQANITSVAFVDTKLTNNTNFDAVPITITTADTDIAYYKVYNCKGNTHKDVEASEASQTTFVYENDPTVISSLASALSRRAFSTFNIFPRSGKIA